LATRSQNQGQNLVKKFGEVEIGTKQTEIAKRGNQDQKGENQKREKVNLEEGQDQEKDHLPGILLLPVRPLFNFLQKYTNSAKKVFWRILILVEISTFDFRPFFIRVRTSVRNFTPYRIFRTAMFISFQSLGM